MRNACGAGCESNRSTFLPALFQRAGARNTLVLTAISFSGPAPRMTSDVVRRAASALQAAAGTLADRFTERATG